jgi:hypothetical protein
MAECGGSPEFGFSQAVTVRQSFGSQDMRRGFLELPSSFSTDQLLRTAVERLEFGGYLGFGGFLTCGQKFAL